MSGRYLLDTNIIIALFAEDDAVMQQLARADQVFTSSIVLGELYFGAHKSTRATENTARIDELAATTTILFCDSATAKNYGVIKNQLKVSGTPIPENDIWIAAMAKQNQLVLVSRDSHFQAVGDLQIEQW